MKEERVRIGYWDKSCKEPLWQPKEDQAHGILCAPTRTGKDRDIIAQMLMTFEGSVFCVDPKGQMAAVTARYRQEVLKQDVCVLNPFNILPDYLKGIRHAQFDPLISNLDPCSETFAIDADNLMDGLMPYGGPETHWIDTARQFGSGGSMYLRKMYVDHNLPVLYQFMSGNDLYRHCQEASVDSGSEEIKARLSRLAAKDAHDNRELRSAVSTAITQLAFMGNEPIAKNMSASTVDFRPMKKRPMTVYLILAGRYLKTCCKWSRVITNSWAEACLQEGGGNVPVLGILNEFKNTIGKLDSVETLNAMGAGYGCRLLTVIQDLNQLQELYPKGWETWLANAGYRIFFAPRDWNTSEYISRMTGTKDIHQVNRSFGKQTNISESTQGRRAWLPEEIRELPGNEMLVFADGIPGVIRAGRRPYYHPDSKEFAGKFDKDPYHEKKTQ